MWFDATEEKEETGYELIPPGTYKVVVDSCEAKRTSAGTGTYVATGLEIVTDSQAGRKLWANFNIENPNEKATKIGRGQFKNFLVSVGKGDAKIQDPAQLVHLQGLTCLAEVEVKKDRDGQVRNNVKKFLGQEELSYATPTPASNALPEGEIPF